MRLPPHYRIRLFGHQQILYTTERVYRPDTDEDLGLRRVARASGEGVRLLPKIACLDFDSRNLGGERGRDAMRYLAKIFRERRQG